MIKIAKYMKNKYVFIFVLFLISGFKMYTNPEKKINLVVIYQDNKNRNNIIIELIEKKNDSFISKQIKFQLDSIQLDSIDLNYCKLIFKNKEHSFYRRDFLFKNDSLFNCNDGMFLYSKTMNYPMENNIGANDIMSKQTKLIDKIDYKNHSFYKIMTINTNYSNSTEIFTFENDFWFIEYYINYNQDHKYVIKSYAYLD
jgi:hypothetical protein